MNNPEHDIYRSLRLNRIIVLASIIASVIISVSALIYSRSVFTYNMNHALALSADGEIIPLEFVERSNVIGIQMKQHLANWYGSYYTFDQNNMKEQRAKGLYLISGEDGQKLEAFYTGNGWYNDITRRSLKQTTTIVPGSIEITGVKEPYQFKCSLIIEVHPLTRPDLKEQFRMNAVGSMTLVNANWPLNSQGLIIHNYRETAWVKIVEK